MRSLLKPDRWIALVFACGILSLVQTAQGEQRELPPSNDSVDLVIENGHIIDGNGSSWYLTEIGIKDGRIAAIGNLKGRRRTLTLDAGGKVVAPGFIDMLGQSEGTILVDPRLPSKIFQGVTTEITGEGLSAGPVDARMLADPGSILDLYHVKQDWHTLGEFCPS